MELVLGKLSASRNLLEWRNVQPGIESKETTEFFLALVLPCKFIEKDNTPDFRFTVPNYYV